MNLRVARILGLTAATAMVVAVGLGMAAGSFVDELQSVLDLTWGRVTLVDLAAGLVLIGAWITWREGSIGRAAPWWLALALTGNLASGVYVARAAWSSKTFEEFMVGTRG